MVCLLRWKSVQLVRTKNLEETQQLKKSNQQTFHEVKLTESEYMHKFSGVK